MGKYMWQDEEGRPDIDQMTIDHYFMWNVTSGGNLLSDLHV
jgi:hypothetical protein